MFQIAEVQFYPWDKIYDFNTDGYEVKIRDCVLVETDLGAEMGKVVGLKEAKEEDYYILADREPPLISGLKSSGVVYRLRLNPENEECRH